MISQSGMQIIYPRGIMAKLRRTYIFIYGGGVMIALKNDYDVKCRLYIVHVEEETVWACWSQILT